MRAPAPIRALQSAGNDFMNNHGMALAAGLSYYFVLSLFPLLIALACIVPYLPIPNLWDKLLYAMGRIVPGEAMGLVQKVVTDVLAQTHPKLLSVGILGTIYAATGGFGSMIEALNVAYDVPETRPWWRTRLLALGLTFVIGAFFIVALAVMVVGPQFGGWLAAKVGMGPVFAYAWNYIRWAVAIAFTIMGVEVLYFLAPNVKQRFWATLPGAALAVAAWIAASYGLGIYFQKFANFNKTYGTLGAVIALFVWFYWTNIFILFGAELNSELRKAIGKKPLPVKENVVPLELPKVA